MSTVWIHLLFLGAVVQTFSLQLTLEIRDFLASYDKIPEQGILGHPDFESYIGSHKGLVQATLGVDEIPVRTNVEPNAIKLFDSKYST